MANPSKDTVYVDIDDEITSIIDKVHESQAPIVALVLPKRATMLQSSVNMKLLKKAAEGVKKRVVLITTEAGLLPLASSVGMYVAKNLQSKPEIPTADMADTGSEIEELAAGDEELPKAELDTKSAADKPVGELAGAAAVAEESVTSAQKAKPELTPIPIPRAKSADDAEEAIELDNTDDADAKGEDATKDAAAAGKGKKTKDKKAKVPNFERFRLRLILVVALLIVLIVGFIIANIILPKADIIISTNTSNISSNQTLNLSTAAKSLDPSQDTVPATVQQTQKSNAQQVSTTGQKNEGKSATGSIIVNEDTTENFFTGCAEPTSIPAGTSVTSSEGTTFIITPNAATFSGGAKQHGSQCEYTSNKVPVVAQSPGQLGSSLPSSSDSFSVNDSNVNATATASGDFTDGTNDVVQVVSQADISNATSKLSTPDTSSIKSALQKSLQQAGLYAITATFNAGTPSTSQSANVGDQATTVTVTQTTTYTMLGVHKSDLQKLVDSDVNSQIDTSKQAIISDGLNSASFSLLGQASASSAQLTMQATTVVGPKLDIAGIKKQVAGKKTGDVESTINADPGVTSVSVHYSPFWVSSVPNHTNKITIQIKKS